MRLSTEHKIFLFGGLATVLIIGGGIFLLSSQNQSTQTQLSKPFIGQQVQVLSRQHLPDGTKIQYNSNPPAAGAHYAKPQDAGIYTTPPPDGNLVHSLEHGAIIIWYNPKMLSKEQIKQLADIFNSISLSKTIMTPRESMGAPIALTSWGRILKLSIIDEQQIKTFFETNYDRGPEQAPI